jgi:hypothetical protein
MEQIAARNPTVMLGYSGENRIAWKQYGKGK